ncbi:Voltage-dependent calcium channel type D subunit alpha-1 (DmCa1D) [Durusdinium trenchii]|uniref:Voltage-dependent calcium channel type D subunit alpha-1 (DmCa1D) n=1 Tax=Durusdinium trenchii TaxID=1381693 RepID=A0ABP0I695_9DINO
MECRRLMIIETNYDAECFPKYANDLHNCPSRSSEQTWLQVSTIALQTIYTVECCLRACVEQRHYVWNTWNQIDLWTAIFGWIGLGMSSMNLNVLRTTIRVLRLLRVGRLVISVPELYILLSGLTTSFKPILFGSIMLVSVILVWSIIVVELIHPLNSQTTFDNCPRCSNGFKSVYSAALTLFSQIVAGDSWGSISIPLAEERWWVGALLFVILMTISLGVMNLILAVIVEKAAEARENDQERKTKLQDEERQKEMLASGLFGQAL